MRRFAQTKKDHLMKIKDQLGKIFNRIDVVVGRWGDKWNTRLRIPQPRDICTNFLPRQLAPFSRFGALCNFYL